MPREVHETYELDPDDPENPDKHRRVGFVVITRETPWDEKSQARALALTEYEDSLCRCGCGLPRDIAHKEQPFLVHDFVCYAGRAIEALRAKHRVEHKGNDAWFDGRQYVAVPADKKADDN
jgi:hypothetical protein